MAQRIFVKTSKESENVMKVAVDKSTFLGNFDESASFDFLKFAFVT